MHAHQRTFLTDEKSKISKSVQGKACPRIHLPTQACGPDPVLFLLSPPPSHHTDACGVLLKFVLADGSCRLLLRDYSTAPPVCNRPLGCTIS